MDQIQGRHGLGNESTWICGYQDRFVKHTSAALKMTI